jgi:predicted nucleotidyltransferase
MDGVDRLSARELDVARAVIAEEATRREHLVVALSGAHAYGFPSPDSDLDLKAIHIASTASLLGLSPKPGTRERQGFVDGVEIDYTSNEVGQALSGMLQGNGNYLERVLGQSVLEASPALASLRPIAKRALSRRVHRHYRGFATSQLRELTSKPTAKKLLYVLRTTLTGAHLLRSGELITDLGELLDQDGFGEARALIERKRAGENTPLDGDTLERWQRELTRAFEVLDDAEKSSALPLEPDSGELEDWLLDVRKSRL